MILMTRQLTFIISLTLLGLFSSVSYASDVQIKPIQEADKQWIKQQTDVINTLSSQHLKRKLNNNTQEDLETLQLLLNKNIINKDQVNELRALGVVLGNLYIEELGVHWVIYQDTKGRSLGLQWMDSERIYFPVTKISRIARANMDVNTKKVYDNGLKKMYQAIKENNRQKMSTLK